MKLIQRFGSAANLNIHMYCLIRDGFITSKMACRSSTACAYRFCKYLITGRYG
ncbi:hypothetical protein [Candidatus Nitrotoga sp. 1052]|uniref:hypothetical protein n=1 Tax=Candidatus Nitrotoga sp. 1052 TaxID=2886964 RepID=UPI00403DED77